MDTNQQKINELGYLNKQLLKEMETQKQENDKNVEKLKDNFDKIKDKFQK